MARRYAKNLSVMGIPKMVKLWSRGTWIERRREMRKLEADATVRDTLSKRSREGVRIHPEVHQG